MIDWLAQALDSFTTRFLGISFSFGNFIVLGLFFLGGYYFGKLTKNLNILKVILIVFIGSQIYLLLHAAHYMIIWAFLFGIIANHGPLIYRAYYWAYDLKDVLFALKNRKAFNDIRRREEELEERIRQFRKEKKAFERKKTSKPPEHGKSKQTEKPNHSKSKARAKPKSDSKPSSYQDQLRAKHLQVLRLTPEQSYNSDHIRKAYRTMVKKVHPDMGGSQTAFIEVVNAYEWLRKNSNVGNKAGGSQS